MRAGGCTVTQTLTAEAASVVKHAVALARQRGHAQVTPLHVAATLLAPGAMSLLRRACLKSHPHSASQPLQCRALELCFKVALNRLPTTSGPLLQPGHPSLSNALVAALKRAQAHQRRGCLEQQQQPLLAVKVDMDQLIISILDDPSVSRVMREAGFSSTFIKNNLEDETSSMAVNVSFPSSFHNAGEVSVSGSAAKIKGLVAEAVEMGCGLFYGGNNGSIDGNGRTGFFESPHVFKAHKISGFAKSEDVEKVLEVLSGKKTRRSNSVIVGDCFLTTDNVVREVMIRLERGDVPDRALKGVQVITPHFATLSLSRDHVEQKLSQIRRTVNNCLIGCSVIIYAGDLRWAVDGSDNQLRESSYCGVEHVCMELGRMLGSHSESRKVWLMATATYETYMRCQKRQPSLEALWGLQAVPVPSSGGLSLTLQPSTSTEDESKKNGCEVLIPNSHNPVWPMLMPPLIAIQSNTEDDPADKLNCCSECSANFHSEAEALRQQENRSLSSEVKLPLWLLQSKADRQTDPMIKVEAKLRQLRQKWNEGCHTKHSHYFDTLKLQRCATEFQRTNPSPWWCSQSSNVPKAPQQQAWPEMSTSFPGSNVSPAMSYQFSWSTPENVGDSSTERTGSVQDSIQVKTTLGLGLADTHFKPTNLTADSCTASVFSSQTRQFNPESVKELTEMISKKVPWQSKRDVRAIASAVVESRSRETNINGNTWLMVLGPDEMGKRKTAQALAQIMYGSQEKLITLGGPCSRGPAQDSIVDDISKPKTYLEKLTEAIEINPHSLILLHDMEHADFDFLGAITKAIERGALVDSHGREASLYNTIIFMTSSLGAKYFSSSTAQLSEEKLLKVSAEPCWDFKLVLQKQANVGLQGHNMFKRKTEWDVMEEKESDKRNRTSPGLDLNVQAEELGDSEVEHNEEALSDVTQETVLQTDALTDQIISCARACFPQKFLQSLDKCLVFNASDFSSLSETILQKLHNAFGQGTNFRGSLEVDSKVLERMVLCCWELPSSDHHTFQSWVQDVFQEGLSRMLSLHTLTPKSVVRLSLKTSAADCFYTNTKLPARVEVDPVNY